MMRLRQTLTLSKLCGIAKICRKPTLAPSLAKRTYSLAGPEINPKYENRARLRDRLSPDHKLVYYSKSTLYYNVCYHVSYLLVLTSIGAIIYVIMGEPNRLQYPVLNEYFHVPHRSETEVLVIYSLVVLLNLFFFTFCRAHVARIWYNSKTNKYLIVSCNGLPGGFMKKLECNPGDATRKYPTIENWLAQAWHTVNGETRHFTDARFRYPIDYHRLVGTENK